MASKPKAKPKKAVKKPAKKASSKAPKVEKLKGEVAGVGHNGKVNKPLLKLFESYEAHEADKKAISKAQRDIRAKAKEEHSVDKEVFAHEIKMRKKASDARVMFEQGHADLKDSLGYQHVLPLLEGSEEDISDDHIQGDEEGVDLSEEDEGQAA